MSFRFIEDHRAAYPVRLMCAVLEVSPAGYYAWRERPVSERAKSSAALLAAIRQVHHDSSGRYGSPRVHAVLRRQGRGTSRGRVERMMRRNGIHAIMAPPRRARTTDSRHDLPIAPNRIARDFTAPAPNRVWLADITYIPTAEGWLYLAAVMDLFSRKIVGWAMRDRLYASRTRIIGIDDGHPAATAAGRIGPSLRSRGAVCFTRLSKRPHTRGYRRFDEPQGRLLRDNAPMESFFHTLKTELVHHRNYSTRAEAQRDIFVFIESFYNRTRLHSAIGYIAPIEMELKVA